MKRQLMAEQWNEFARVAIPVGASRVQRKDIRRAFYAGGNAMLAHIVGAFPSPAADAETKAERKRLMEGLFEELTEFGEAIKAGRA